MATAKHIATIPEAAVPGDSLGEFEVVEVLYRGERSTVLRCRTAGEQRVVKFLRREALGVGDVARFRREYELSRRVAHPHVVSAETLGSHAGALFLTMPDDGATALRDVLRSGPLPVADALSVAIALIDALAEVHAHDILHKDIAPGNVVIDLARGVVKLIDFGISAEISSERPALSAPAELEGTLACMAPEQTGRTNGDVDYRSDFYSLGATLYSMLAGTSPFPGHDPVALVHAHLALTPPPLAGLCPAAPPALCQVVEKLLAKQPEGRYQSHDALRRDLVMLHGLLDAPELLRGWVPAVGDLPQQFQVSSRLYGRTDETLRLLAAFEMAASGPAQLVLVEGAPGIGKTALVHEVLRALLARRGEMVEGKFNQFGQQAPGAAFAQALRQRARQVLSGSSAHQRPWRAALLAQLGANAALAVQAVPELALLFEHAPRDVPPLGPQEAENRFLRTLCGCFAALSSEQQPLVVFIDDLQWADRVSRRLLRELALDDSLRYLLVVGAFRDDVLGDEHPLARDIAGWSEAGRPPIRLAVGPLLADDVAGLLVDTLQRSPADAELRGLADLCHLKTGGNPFFLGRFLLDLQRRRLIWRDPAGPSWRWSLEQIRRERIADNVVALMLEQLRRLPLRARDLLTIAACLDARFSLRSLALICDEPEDTVMRGLEPALAAGMLTPSDVRYKWVGVLDADERAGLDVELAFAHDRVQEAAYLLTAEGDRAALHLHIGRMLRPTMDPAVPDFAVVNHLNRGGALAEADPADRAQLALWNMQLSYVARDRASFDLAADHAARAVALFGPGFWQASPAAALELCTHAARMAGLRGDDNSMQRLIDEALAQPLRSTDRALLIDVRVEASYGLGRLDETIELGLEALRLLDLQLPVVAGLPDVLRLVAELRDEIEAVGMVAVADLPVMKAALPHQQLAVIARMTAAAYIARPMLLPLLTVVQLRLMLRHGHAPQALSAYTVMGLLVAEFLGDYRFGWSLGRMSMGLIDRHGWQTVQAHAGFSFGAFLQHWVEPPRETLPAWIEIHRNGLENGNLRHAGLALVLHGSHALLGGLPLSQVEVLLARHLATLRRIRQPVAHDYVLVLHESVRALQRNRLLSRPLEHDGYVRDAALQGFAARKDQTGALFVHVFECCLLALAGRHAEAVVAGEAAAAMFSAGRGLGMVAFCIYFTASSRLALVLEGRPPAGWEADVEAAIARFTPWLAASARLLPLQQLLLAQRAAVQGDEPAMRQALDHALAAVRDADDLMLLAIVRQQRALLIDAPAERAEARAVLLRWGAPAAAAALFAEADEATVSTTPERALDLGALMKAVQAVTAEIAVAPLLQRLLQVLRENAGAVRAVVVLRGERAKENENQNEKENERWLLQADSSAPADAPAPEAVPLEQCNERLPLEILRTVLATGQAIRADDALHEHPWQRLPYVTQRSVRSLLCLPLVRQGVAVGALYLENDAASGAFPPQRIEFLELLLGNLVSALENARLYAEVRGLADSLERRVAERTRELRASEERTLTILRNIPLPVVVSRVSDDVFVYANERAAALVGMSISELVGRLPHTMYRFPADRERMYAEYDRDGLVHDFEANLVDASGRGFWALISLVPVVYDGESARLTTVVDISHRKAEEQALRRAAATDDLTGLAGRGHFMRIASEALQAALLHGRPMALVMLDVDHFKQINDRYGHAAGDMALRDVAQLCSTVTRAEDLAGRIGGEEFCLLLPGIGADAALVLAERLRGAMEGHPIDMGGRTVTLTASLGVTEVRAGDSMSLLLARADAALYAAKRGGRNQVAVA